MDGSWSQLALCQFPWRLLALVPLAGYLGLCWRREKALPAGLRHSGALILHGLALLALILAWAGLQFPGARPPAQVVAAVDLSGSIYDPGVQEATLRQFAACLEGTETEWGLALFARGPLLVRPLAPVTPRSPGPGADSRGESAAPGAAESLSSAPRLHEYLAALERDATDLGGAISFARGLLPGSHAGPQAVVLLTDGLDTEGAAAAAAAAAGLAGSNVSLLIVPAPLGGGGDVRVAGMQVPERARVGRGLPIEVTIAGLRPANLRVRLSRRTSRDGKSHLETLACQDVALTGAPTPRIPELRAGVTFTDRPAAPGVVTYVATVEGPGGAPLPDDFTQNNTLAAAARVDGPARWAVLARPSSTLAAWAVAPRQPLGVEMQLFAPGSFPASEAQYAGFTGVLVDGLSAGELPPDSAALVALHGAARLGLGLVALGGPGALGAGAHPEGGLWEQILPVTFRPEDDRTRAILFVVDVSNSMDEKFRPPGQKELVSKLQFAREQLGVALKALAPADRVGLLAFASTPHVAAPLSPGPGRAAFIQALNGLGTENRTDLRGALVLAREVLAADDAEEQWIVLLSDGIQTVPVTEEDLRAAVTELCPAPEAPPAPRRRRLFAFGIATGAADSNAAGEARLKALAAQGGGEFHANFLRLAQELEQVFQPREDLYARGDEFAVQAPASHPLLAAAGPAWPLLSFRNRVKPRPESEVLLRSAPRPGAPRPRRPDPLLVLGRHDAARTAVLALTLDGPSGAALLQPQGAWPGGGAFLGALLAWCEGAPDPARRGWRLEAEAVSPRKLRVVLFAADPAGREPQDGLILSARLEPLESESAASASARTPSSSAVLRPVAPGRYETELPADREGVLRLELLERGTVVAERFVSVPYPPEYRRFGTDRLALADLAARAGGASRLLDLPQRDFPEWLQSQADRRGYTSAGPALLALALVFFLASLVARGWRRER